MDLIELKKKFDDFRKNKNSRAVRFPHYLWQEVSKQIKIHGRAKVQKTLNLRCDQIRNYCSEVFTEEAKKGKDENTKKSTIKSDKQIVEIPNFYPENNSNESVISLEICDRKITITTQTSVLDTLLPEIMLKLGV